MHTGTTAAGVQLADEAQTGGMPRVLPSGMAVTAGGQTGGGASGRQVAVGEELPSGRVGSSKGKIDQAVEAAAAADDAAAAGEVQDDPGGTMAAAAAAAAAAEWVLQWLTSDGEGAEFLARYEKQGIQRHVVAKMLGGDISGLERRPVVAAAT